MTKVTKILPDLTTRRRLSGLGLSLFSNPKLFIRTAAHVAKRRFRVAKSAVRARKSISAFPYEGQETLSIDALVRQLSDQFGLLELGKSEDKIALGLADVNFLDSIDFLNSKSNIYQTKINGQNTSVNNRDFNKRALAAHTVEVSILGADGNILTISLEVYYKQETGIWLSNNTQNRQARALRDDRLLAPGSTTIENVLGGQTLQCKTRDRTIDAVYTWVDHSDENWSNLYKKALTNNSILTDAGSISRFHNNNELKYSLRSLWQNAPWINNIYILSNCKKPDWLKESHPKIIWVDHSEVLPKKVLPTFNSHAIESSLHRLPGISKYFLYLNDDVFFSKPAEKNFFFDHAGSSKSFLESYGMVSGPVILGDPDYLNAARNSSRMLHEKFGFVATQLHQHTIFALRRDILMDIENKWKEEFDRLIKCTFRTSYDFNLTSFLYHHYALGNGDSHEASIRNAFIKPSDPLWRVKLNAFEPNEYDTLCINEGGKGRPPQDWYPVVGAFLDDLFPISAPWEN